MTMSLAIQSHGHAAYVVVVVVVVPTVEDMPCQPRDSRP